ncbi:hypothetical protein GCM10010399_58940 [Dactylosporangium fulvum]|uniref:MmyB-like transcription regulator ligand binding domain-containing protein n=1 Tax=Dactylosporangium fulvum TaxID=53359 RepID=A0ABY5VMV8_9ACTN|nr:protealysin inhibitor emfourin [Dactylosporangium fulvum]UWP78983.1 hypothetical protein Dfulv_27865 [Dactylosporangium fulvum]
MTVRVELRRTGGIGGGELRTTVVSTLLPAAQADKLRSLVAALPLPPEGLPQPPPPPDSLRYELLLDRGGRQLTYLYFDNSLPDAVRELVEHLVSMSGPH